MIMLDTNVIISCIRHPDSTLEKRVKEHLGKDLAISAITYAELEYGIEKSSHPIWNRIAMQKVLAGIEVIPFDMAAGIHFGQIFTALERQGRRISDRDTLIAAHARSLGCTLVTHNVREFVRVEGLCYEDWEKE